MSRDEIQRRVRAVIERTFAVGPEETVLAMGAFPQWDSMGHMELVVELENEFHVTFPSYELSEILTVEAIVEAIERQESR